MYHGLFCGTTAILPGVNDLLYLHWICPTCDHVVLSERLPQDECTHCGTPGEDFESALEFAERPTLEVVR